ncbi:MAG: Hpt domain-containing protein [Magnetococcales bacterium]|nr:Hpt domain-containing protein [Magnetococcales bacterium]MBF0157382.1 Hpt domain-containing protein [Magnetococcales bacterium]
MASDSERITVSIDKDLEDIAPGYLENRRKDLELLPQALEKADYATLRVLGHRMKGSGAGYGFNLITEIGRAIEEGAKSEDAAAIRNAIDNLGNYLERVELVYE